jgi:hypothetical protein
MKRVLFTLAAFTLLTGEAAANNSAPVPAPRHNVHKERDHRFKACKAAATEAGVSSEQLQAFMAECMKKVQ